MLTMKTLGRRMVFFGALALLAWSVYELSIRVEEMTIWLTPVFSLVREGKLGFFDYFSRVPWHRLTTHLFLLVCALFSLAALFTRKRLLPLLFYVPIAILLIVFSLGSTPLMGANLWQKLKMLPLVLIGLGSALVFAASLVGSKQKKAAGPQPPPAPKPYDPFGMNRGQ